MDKIIFMCIVLIMMHQKSISQEYINSTSDSSKIDEPTNSLKSGMWAIQFGIGSDFTLTNLDDATLSLKSHLTPNSAIRLSFTGIYLNSKDDLRNNVNYQLQILRINPSLLYFINTKAKLNIYFSSGLQYSYYYYYNSDPDIPGGEFRGYGITFGLGAEYFPLKKVSLFAQYNYNLSLNKLYFDEVEEINLSNNVVNFGISVYFNIF